MAVFHSQLDTACDWNKVSVGKKGSKKTSNTSLTLSGKKKLIEGLVLLINDELYINTFKRLGAKL